MITIIAFKGCCRHLLYVGQIFFSFSLMCFIVACILHTHPGCTKLLSFIIKLFFTLVYYRSFEHVALKVIQASRLDGKYLLAQTTSVYKLDSHLNPLIDSVSCLIINRPQGVCIACFVASMPLCHRVKLRSFTLRATIARSTN